MLVEAPGRLSTTTVCPMTSVSFAASARVTTSMMPPGELGTTMRTGRFG